MPGASEQTRRVKILNANWLPGPDADDDRFEIMIVTEDDEQHTISASPPSMTALVALAQADTVMAWDPVDRTLIAANIVGTMPWRPPAFRDVSVVPSGARYDDQLGEYVLPYEVVRTATVPDRVLLDFLQSTYEAAATTAAWDRAILERLPGNRSAAGSAES